MTNHGMKQTVYLDHNATTNISPDVVNAMAEIMRRGPYNASSVHATGREARKLLDRAREQVAKATGAEGYQVIFTATGTEANNLALKGISRVHVTPVVSATEHISVLKAAKDAHSIPVDENGVVKLDALRRILAQVTGKALVSVMLANNETGVIQPIREIAKLTYEHGGFVHTDATQALGKILLDIATLNVDMVTISAHKFGGPQGVAALIAKRGLDLHPLVAGGAQESGMRAGTENVAAIVGMGLAAEQAAASIMTPELRNYMDDALKSYAPGSHIFGEKASRLPNTTCIAMPNMTSETQLIAFDLEGVAVSSGSACSSGKVDVSHVLLAMGVSQEEAKTAIRISLGRNTTKEEIDRFIDVWKMVYDRANKPAEQAA